MALTDGRRVEREDLPEEVRAALPKPRVTSEVQPLAELERKYVLAALERNKDHRARTAEQLGIGKTTLYRKLKSYGT